MKITLFGLINDNIGDTAILDNAKYLIKSANPDTKIGCVYLFVDRAVMKFFAATFSRLEKKLIKAFGENFCNWYKLLKWKKFAKNRYIQGVYKRNIKNKDAVIFAGGGLVKFRQKTIWLVMYSVITLCDKYNVPIYINATGVEGYDEKILGV